jgi:hypothetical protein
MFDPPIKLQRRRRPGHGAKLKMPLESYATRTAQCHLGGSGYHLAKPALGA